MEIKSFPLETNLYDEHRKNPEVFSLLEPNGLEVLRQNLQESKGQALAIVHPFDKAFKNYKDFKIYKQKLIDEIVESKKKGLPLLIFFEGNLKDESEKDEFNNTLKELNVGQERVFLVETEIASPEPINGDLKTLSNMLNISGLKNVNVAGCYLWEATDNAENTGCVGHVLDCFLQADINAVPSSATYPLKNQNPIRI